MARPVVNKPPPPPPGALRQTGWPLRVTVEGTSMEPLFRQGDVVTVQCSPWDMCPGDIVCFRRGGDHVLHRLIDHRNGKWLEKGDAELGGSWIDPDQILGRVTQLNGHPLDKGAGGTGALVFARWEARLSHLLACLRVRKAPRGLSRLWRRMKQRRLAQPHRR